MMFLISDPFRSEFCTVLNADQTFPTSWSRYTPQAGPPAAATLQAMGVDVRSARIVLEGLAGDLDRAVVVYEQRLSAQQEAFERLLVLRPSCHTITHTRTCTNAHMHTRAHILAPLLLAYMSIPCWGVVGGE